MDHYRVIGNPVAHSRSPWIHARFAQLTGQALAYDRQLVAPGDFRHAVDEFRLAGGKGCNVTVPFKFEAAALATDLTPRGALAGACNTLRFDGQGVSGDNTDGAGLVRDITVNAGVALAGRAVLLIGAGGAAAGVLGPLLQARPRRLVVANRTLAAAALLVARHRSLARDLARDGTPSLEIELTTAALNAIPGDFDVVVNASASSLAGAGVPVAARVLKPGALACDLMYGDAAQAFMAWAAAHGAVPRDGLGMLVEQAAEAFAFWRGVRPPAAQVLAELRVLMAAAP